MLSKNLSDEYIQPAKIFGNLYYVGVRAVCTHLIDTGDGLILIDPGYYETLQMILDNIRQVGFDPKDIKYIVITHAHYDHMDAVNDLVAICGGKTFIGEADLPLLTGEIYHYPLRSFTPDVLLKDGDTIELGNTSIYCMSTPGHTDGTMSFFFNVTDGVSTYRAGLFGGAGTNTLVREFLEKHQLPDTCRQDMLNSLAKLKKEKVELFLGNHLPNNHTEEKLALLPTAEVNPFIANSQAEWEAFLNARTARVQQIIDAEA
ncbi:MAG: MBL fold metallo-hydrolase [Oscillospiraceae bacterium]|nr:MBL fold metallo-hydrolase [Oscillospiraceae bacterium]